MNSHQNESSQNSDNISKPLELFRIFMALLCPMVVIGFSIHLRLQLERKLLISIVRSIVQLLLAGFVLLSFIFSINNFAGVIFYIFLMSLIAALETVSRQKRTYKGHYIDSLISIILGGAMVGTYGTIIVFNPDPWWNSSVMIPTAGMIIGSAVSGPSLAVERLLSEICEKRHETETRLGFGANKLEAVLPIIRSALLAALTPNLNQMAVVGLVSIPGMMTGQLLAGATPLVATQYQMCILWLINGSAAISTYIALHLTILHAVFDQQCRISAQKIITQEKKSIDVALIKNITICTKKICSIIQQVKRQNYQKSVADLESKETDGRDKDLEISDSHQIIKRQKCKYQFEERSQTNEFDEIIFQVRNINVMSGSFPLFERNQGLNFDIKKGERIILQGPSGLGKTRILRALSQLDEPYEGDMKFMNFVNSEMPNWRARIIYVPQSLPPMDGSPKDLLKESLKYKSRSKSISLKEIDSQCNSMFLEVGLDVSKSDQAWLKLSGGERQRSVIAISIILAKSFSEAILLLDEPTAACDAASQIKVEQALIQSGVSIIMITHDENQASLFGHRIIKFSQSE